MRAPIVQQINDHLKRLLGEDGFGLIERSNHIAILPREGTVELVPYRNYYVLERALAKYKTPGEKTVWRAIGKCRETDPEGLAVMITADLWTWFDREGGRAIASERHFGKKGVY